MIVVDTSVLFAVVAHDPEREIFIEILDRNDAACSTVTYVETVMVLTGRSQVDSKGAVDDLLRASSIEVVPVDGVLADHTVAAFIQYGKGRHPARLNLADCFTYALAKSRNCPLLFKGDDFAKTDIVAAWRP